MTTWFQCVLILACCGLVESVETGFVYCPAYPCTCESKDGVLIINCRSLYLSSLPKFLSFEGRIKELSLRHNSIKSLPAKGFLGFHIEKLDLLENAVTFIDNDAFSGLEDSMRSLSVQLYALEGLPTLALSRLRRLRYLKIVGCKQRELHADLFLNLALLEELHLIGCRILQIRPEAFSSLANLDTLVLANNALRFRDIPEINLLDKLIKLDLSFNDLQFLEDSAFSQLPKLRTLKLGSNKLSYIAIRAFSNLEFSLEELDLRENGVTEHDLSSLADLKVLRRLDLSFNRIANLSGKYFVSLRYLTSLDMAHNKVKVIDRESFRGLSSILELDLGNNPVRLVEVGAFSELTALVRLNINNTNLGGTFPSQILKGMSASLGHIDVSNSSIVSGDIVAFSLLINLTDIDLSHNRITELDLSLLGKLIKLTHANFSHNNISVFLMEHIPTFDSNLKLVDLSWNKIETIESCYFSAFKKLDEILLEGNPLTCNCSLSWLYRWFQMTHSSQNPEHDKWTCSAPDSLKGSYFSQLDFANLKCSNSSSSLSTCQSSDTLPFPTEAPAETSTAQVTPVCRPICVNVSRPQHDNVYVQWLMEVTDQTSGFNLTIKRHNDSLVLKCVSVTANSTNYTFPTDVDSEHDICVTAVTRERSSLAQKCQPVPNLASIKDEISKKQQLNNLIHNSFVPLMFIYISGSLSLAFIVACVVVCVRRKQKRPMRVKPMCVAYPAWLDHRTSVSSSSLTHHPQFLNTLFLDTAGSHDSRTEISLSTESNDGLSPDSQNPGANLPLDFPLSLSSRRESGMDNAGNSSDTSGQLPTDILNGPIETGNNFFFHF